ncbi:glycoside hydrolase family 24 protein [Roseateles chitinivorans]|uniref:glycoside hydrolase family 24 protein n=1 Tax=Roseateles chitinivorans TaxID=2917965 RepID=UPI003D67C6A6
MRPAQALVLTAAASVLIVASRRSGGQIEAGEGDYLGGFSTSALIDSGESLLNQITQAPANVDGDTAARNTAAFLTMLQYAEGTAGQFDPYRVCYGYSHTIQDLSNHPAVTGEWRGQPLSDSMCELAGFGPGCVSSAAGAYQLIKGTWLSVQRALSLPDFSGPSQDAAAVELIRRRGALEDVKAGRFTTAVGKCRNEWASLPGNYAQQGQRSIETLAGWYGEAGGTIA